MRVAQMRVVLVGDCLKTAHLCSRPVQYLRRLQSSTLAILPSLCRLFQKTRCCPSWCELNPPQSNHCRGSKFHRQIRFHPMVPMATILTRKNEHARQYGQHYLYDRPGPPENKEDKIESRLGWIVSKQTRMSKFALQTFLDVSSADG